MAKARNHGRSLTATLNPAFNSRKFLLGAATGLVISGGLVAYHSYSVSGSGSGGIGPTTQKNKNLWHSSLEPEYLQINVDEKLMGSTPAADLKWRLPRHLRRTWRLVHQANTDSYEQHLLAVRNLAKLARTLNDGEMRQVAQSCQLRTAVGLARIEKVDRRFFLHPAPLPVSMETESLHHRFHLILESMPQSVHHCLQFFTTTALENYSPGSNDEAVRDDDIGHEFHHDTHHIHTIPRPRYSPATFVEYCLQALVSHSTVKEHCLQMIRTACLPFFVRLVRDFPDSARVKSLIGKILANMSLFEETHGIIFASGWVGLLAQWKNQPNLLISLPATKALANLDRKFSQHTYHPGIYLIRPEDRLVQHLSPLSNWGVDVVFLHGLLGGVFYTWRQSDPGNRRQWHTSDLISSPDYSFCWPRDWLFTDTAAMTDRVRVIGVDFDTHLSQWWNPCPIESFQTSLADRSHDILNKLKQCGVGQRPVIFVGHSMGGLIVKAMLTQAADSPSDEDRRLAANTRGVVFYSTPHFGTHMAKLSATSKLFFFPTVEFQDLEANSAMLINLNNSFKEMAIQNQIRVLSFGESQAEPFMGMDLTFVPPTSSNPGFGEFHMVKGVDHINICKPDSKSSILFRKLANMVWDSLDQASPYE